MKVLLRASKQISKNTTKYRQISSRFYSSKTQLQEMYENAKTDADRIEIRGEMAESYAQDGDYVTARDLYNEAYVLALNSKNDDALFDAAMNLGKILFVLEDYSNALAVYEFAHSKVKDSKNNFKIFETLIGLANCHQVLNDFKVSINLYKKALKVAPDDKSEIMTYDNLATLYVTCNDKNRAKKYAAKALKLARSHGDSYTLMVVLYNYALGCSVFENSPEQASETTLACLEEALKLAKDLNDVDMTHLILKKKMQINNLSVKTV